MRVVVVIGGYERGKAVGGEDEGHCEEGVVFGGEGSCWPENERMVRRDRRTRG